MIHPQPIGPIEAAQRAAHAECRRRLMGVKVPATDAPPPAEPVIVVARIIERPKPTPMPLWKRGDIEFTAHIDAWHAEQRQQTSPVRYLKRRAKELGFTYQDMVGPYRGRSVVAARQLLIWEIKQKFPHVSFPQLGRMFGGRDHTTCLWAVRQVETKRSSQ
jgi:hypothetical protein